MSCQPVTTINSKIPLLWAALVTSGFGLFMLLNPAGLLEQYQISMSNVTQTDSMTLEGMFQQLGIFNIMMGAIFLIACRVGLEQTRRHVNLAAAVSSFINILMTARGIGAFTSLGVPMAGIMFNLCLTAVTMILCGLGAGLSFELAPLKKPIYWGITAMGVVFLVYALMFLLISETLLSGYGLTFDDDKIRTLILAMSKYGWPCVCFQMSALLLAGVMSTDFMYTYALNRYISMIQFGQILVTATNVAWWSTRNADGDLDGYIAGQWFNCVLSVVFWLLTYGSVIMLDTQVTEGVKDAIGGLLADPPRSPTLLISESQQKAAFAAPLLA